MTLAPEQIAWADSHVGEETVLAGAVESWSENDDGTVTFHVSFTATPPMTEQQQTEANAVSEKEQAAADAARQKAEDEARQQAEETERERIRSVVHEVLAEK